MDKIQKSAGQILLTSLTKITHELERFTKSFEKFEDKQQGETEKFLTFKMDIINRIKDCDSKIKEFNYAFKSFVDKLDIKDDSLMEKLNELKLEIAKQGIIDYDKIENIVKDQKIEVDYKLADKCGSCELLTDKERWVKRLWKTSAILLAILLTLLGFNVLGFIEKLPGLF
jgi:hypothetical protein